jgi:hypothetical protein
MSETTEACVMGCAIYREHLSECEGYDERGHDCRGCLPRRAEYGHLCHGCHRRFELMLTDAPTVHRWLTGNLPAGAGAARAKDDHERRGGGDKEIPAPISLDILDVRDLLRDRLSCWVDDFAEMNGATAPKAGIDEDAEFLLRWLPRLEALDWIGDWMFELTDTMAQAHALAPWRPPVRRIPRVPCPGCGETNLVIYGGETDVTCQSCKIMLTEERFALWERVLAEETVEAVS